jgi:hypothetical protein
MGELKQPPGWAAIGFMWMNNTADDSSFQWPSSPPYPVPDWFKVTGAELGLEPDQIRFAAALINCGGADSRNNSVAARAAGLELSRTSAFRLARSVKVRKLINAAEEVKAGRRKPLTEDQIDERVDRMCMSPNDRDAAVGIKLRDDRTASRLRVEAQQEVSLEETLARLIASVPIQGAGAFLAMATFHEGAGNLINFPFLTLCAPVVATNFPADWARWREAASSQWHAFLDRMAAGPRLGDDELVIAVKAKVPAKFVAKPAETVDAT